MIRMLLDTLVCGIGSHLVADIPRPIMYLIICRNLLEECALKSIFWVIYLSSLGLKSKYSLIVDHCRMECTPGCILLELLGLGTAWWPFHPRFISDKMILTLSQKLKCNFSSSSNWCIWVCDAFTHRVLPQTFGMI